MNWTRQTTNAGLLYVGTETDGVSFEIAKRKDGKYELTVGGEIAAVEPRLMDAKARAAEVERTILDEMVVRSKAAVEARGIRPGALVSVKGRSAGDVRVKHVGAGYVELERPLGGTFRRPAEDLTVIERSPEDPEAQRAAVTAEALETLDESIDAHNARAEEIDATEALDAIRNRIDVRPSVRKSGELSIHRGDVVRVSGRKGVWTVSRLAPGRIEVERGDETVEIALADVEEIVRAATEGAATELIAELEEALAQFAPGDTVLIPGVAGPAEVVGFSSSLLLLVRLADGTEGPADPRATILARTPEEAPTETLVDVEHAEDAKVGDEVILTEDETVWTIKRIQRKADPDYPNQHSIAPALFTLRDEAGYRTITRDRADFTRKTWADARKAEALEAAAAAVRTPEEIVSAGGVSLGDRAEIADNEGVWVVNQIIEVEGEYLYRLYRTSGAPGNRQTWRLGEEITLLSDEEAAEEEPATEALGEFSREEILSELADSAARFKPEGEYNARQWPGPIFPKEFGPAVVPNEGEGRKLRETGAALDKAREEVHALEPGDRIVYSGARGLEDWTVVGRRNQGGFVSLHVREETGTARWWTVAELAVAVVDRRALLIPIPRDTAATLPLDEAGILRHVEGVLGFWAREVEETIEVSTESRNGAPVLHIDYAGGSYELYATRVG